MERATAPQTVSAGVAEISPEDRGRWPNTGGFGRGWELR
jgi:hypothetical protein